MVREKNLTDRKRAVRIREAQLEYNETRFSERIAQEVALRVQARLANQPEPPPPALAPVFVTLSSRLTTGRSDPMPDDWVTSKPGWDRYLDEKLKSKLEVMALAAVDRKQRFEPQKSIVLELAEMECGLCSRPLFYLSVNEVMRTACGHLFCADCIFRSAIEVPECPTCDEPVDYSDIYSDVFYKSN